MNINKTRILNEQDLQEGLQAICSMDERLTACVEELAANNIPIPLRNQTAGFQGLCGIIISQLVSRESASAIQSRFNTHFPNPDPLACLNAPDATWINIGLSRPKQKAIRCVAQAIIDRQLEFSILHELPPKDAINVLTEIKGIGPWSAEVYVLFCMAHRDVFPAGDLALRKAVGDLAGWKEMPSEQEVRELAGSWSPWRGIAARICWTWAGYIKSRAM